MARGGPRDGDAVAGTDRARHQLSTSSLVQFLVSSFVILIAVGGQCIVNRHRTASVATLGVADVGDLMLAFATAYYICTQLLYFAKLAARPAVGLSRGCQQPK